MDIMDKAVDALRFKDTIIYKSDSDLQERYNALEKLNKEFPDNEQIQEKMYLIKKGLDGEKELLYELSKSNIGMFVLQDVKIEYEDMKAQIDFVVITPVSKYYIECKNLVGNITVNEKGDFIREYTVNGKTIKKGMYSPLRQVEAQREIIKKVWNSKASKITKFFASSHFEEYRKVLVVASNHDTILDTTNAPEEIKDKIIKSDSLVRILQQDYDKNIDQAFIENKKSMEATAKTYLHLCSNEKTNYYDYYKNKYCNYPTTDSDDDLKNRLVELRKRRSIDMNIPAYYVYNNEELEKLIKLKPKTIEELKNDNILSAIKIKTHGEKIIEEINKKS